MIIISHRGNLWNQTPEEENNPKYIDEAISSNFYVEIDVWCRNKNYFLGHDYPQYPVELKWLLDRSDKLYVHCKCLESLYRLADTELETFYHDKDRFTLTKSGKIWTNIGQPLTPLSIAVLPENHPELYIGDCFGICTDVPYMFLNKDKLTESFKGKSVTCLKDFYLSPGEIL